MNEIWADIINYEGIYQISNLGRVKSLSRYVNHPKGHLSLIKERIRKLTFDSDGYNMVNLNKENKSKTHKVHRLVAIHFIENPSALPQVNHLDGNKTNNHFENLEWTDNRENNTHRLDKNATQSKFVGVTMNSRRKTWRSAITINSKSVYLGSFRTEKEASDKYLEALQNYGLSNKYAT